MSSARLSVAKAELYPFTCCWLNFPSDLFCVGFFRRFAFGDKRRSNGSFVPTRHHVRLILIEYLTALESEQLPRKWPRADEHLLHRARAELFPADRSSAKRLGIGCSSIPVVHLVLWISSRMRHCVLARKGSRAQGTSLFGHVRRRQLAVPLDPTFPEAGFPTMRDRLV